MNYKYNEGEILKLLDTDTLKALWRLYGINYQKIAFRLGVTRPAIFYKLEQNAFKPLEKKIILSMLLNHYGMEVTELIIINKMINSAKKVEN